MAASKYKLKIEQGTTFVRHITWKVGAMLTPVDLTGCTARMQMRHKITDAAVLLSLTTENGRLALGGSAGTITMTLTSTETAALNWAEAVYDLEVVFADGSVRRLLQGAVSVSPEVTR